MKNKPQFLPKIKQDDTYKLARRLVKAAERSRRAYEDYVNLSLKGASIKKRSRAWGQHLKLHERYVRIREHFRKARPLLCANRTPDDAALHVVNTWPEVEGD